MVTSDTKAPPSAPAAVKRPVKRALTTREIRALADADARYNKTKREFEDADAERKELVARALPKVKLSGKLGAWIVGGGWEVKISMQSSGSRFSLSEYLKYHKLTAAMREFVSEGSESPRLTVKPNG